MIRTVVVRQKTHNPLTKQKRRISSSTTNKQRPGAAPATPIKCTARSGPQTVARTRTRTRRRRTRLSFRNCCSGKTITDARYRIVCPVRTLLLLTPLLLPTPTSLRRNGKQLRISTAMPKRLSRPLVLDQNFPPKRSKSPRYNNPLLLPPLVVVVVPHEKAHRMPQSQPHPRIVVVPKTLSPWG